MCYPKQYNNIADKDELRNNTVFLKYFLGKYTSTFLKCQRFELLKKLNILNQTLWEIFLPFIRLILEHTYPVYHSDVSKEL